MGIRCYRCPDAADHMQGRQWFCDKHYRFTVMRASASRHGKYVPTNEELEDMVPPDMCCPVCAKTMVWRSADDPKHVISLRHFDANQVKFVCRSCSTKAAFAPVGTIFTHSPNDEKWCPKCAAFKPLAEFYTNGSGHRGYCKPCELSRTATWAKEFRKPRTKAVTT